MTLTFWPKLIGSIGLMVFTSNMISNSSANASQKPTQNLRKMEKVLRTDGYSLNTLFSTLMMTSGKKWVEVNKDPEAAKNHIGFTKFQVILDTSKVEMNNECKSQAPVLVLNVEEIAKNQTKVSIDQSSVFYGQTLEQLFTKNEAIFKKPGFSNSMKNIFDFDVIAPPKMSVFSLLLRVNTNPNDDEDFGTIELTFSDSIFGLSVYNGDDDGGRMFDLGGINRTKYDNDLPKLEVTCNN